MTSPETNSQGKLSSSSGTGSELVTTGSMYPTCGAIKIGTLEPKWHSRVLLQTTSGAMSNIGWCGPNTVQQGATG